MKTERLSVIHLVFGTVKGKVWVRTSSRSVSVAQTQPALEDTDQSSTQQSGTQSLTYTMRSPVSLTRDSSVCLREAARGRLWLQRVPR